MEEKRGMRVDAMRRGRRRAGLVAGVLFYAVCNLWAGDTATLQILGFSEDGRFLAFEQFGSSTAADSLTQN